MNTLLEKQETKEDNQTSFLIQMIEEWPDWKKESICIDQSDIALLKIIKKIG